MRTTVIPAQITTVEDKIAGSLNLTQIIILMIPVIWTTVVFSILPPRLHFTWYKFPIILIVLFTCLILSLRIRGNVVLNWLVVLLRYNTRAKYYLFNKNDSYLRDIVLPESKRETTKLTRRAQAKKEAQRLSPSIAIAELIKAEKLLKNGKYSIIFRQKKGGLNVAFEQIQK